MQRNQSLGTKSSWLATICWCPILTRGIQVKMKMMMKVWQCHTEFTIVICSTSVYPLQKGSAKKLNLLNFQIRGPWKISPSPTPSHRSVAQQHMQLKTICLMWTFIVNVHQIFPISNATNYFHFSTILMFNRLSQEKSYISEYFC